MEKKRGPSEGMFVLVKFAENPDAPPNELTDAIEQLSEEVVKAADG